MSDKAGIGSATLKTGQLIAGPDYISTEPKHKTYCKGYVNLGMRTVVKNLPVC